MPERLLLSQFTVPPLDVPSAISLAHALLTAKPKSAPEHVKEAASDMRSALGELEGAWGTRGASKEGKKIDLRPFDRLVDSVWSSFFWRLDALASLPSDLYPRALRAARLRDRLFSPTDRLGFVKLPYRAEWAEVKKRLDVIEREGLEAEVDELAGPEFRQEMARSFLLYGDVLGITKVAPVDAASEPLLDRLRDLTSAMTSYTVAVLSTIKRKKPETHEAALLALRPLSEAREAVQRVPAAPQPPPTQDDPTKPSHEEG